MKKAGRSNENEITNKMANLIQDLELSNKNNILLEEEIKDLRDQLGYLDYFKKENDELNKNIQKMRFEASSGRNDKVFKNIIFIHFFIKGNRKIK